MRYKYPEHYIVKSIYNDDVVKILSLLPGEFHIFDYEKRIGIKKALWTYLRKQRFIKGVRYHSFRVTKDKGYFFRTDLTKDYNAG